MASSGIYAYTYTRDQIINAALRKLVVLGEGVSANATQLSTGAEALNLITLEFQTLGMPLWARKVVDVTMVATTAAYALTLPTPLKIIEAYRTDTANSSNTDMQVLPNYDFNKLSPTSTGNPVNVTYQPKVGTGTLTVWPTPDTSMPAGTTVHLVYHSEFEIFNAGTDTPDFPKQWYNALVYNLALALAPEYGLPLADQSSLEKKADKHLERALDFGMEDGSIFISPSLD